MSSNEERVQMNQGVVEASPSNGQRPWRQQREEKKGQRSKPDDDKRMTPEDAKRIADQYKSQRGGKPGRRPWTGSPFDPWRQEITALVKQGLRNDEILRWLRTQDRRITVSSTKLRAWLRREGIRVRERTNANDQAEIGAR